MGSIPIWAIVSPLYNPSTEIDSDYTVATHIPIHLAIWLTVRK